jgi:hypothetical protein
MAKKGKVHFGRKRFCPSSETHEGIAIRGVTSVGRIYHNSKMYLKPRNYE